jgi:hypothetical protein
MLLRQIRTRQPHGAYSSTLLQYNFRPSDILFTVQNELWILTSFVDWYALTPTKSLAMAQVIYTFYYILYTSILALDVLDICVHETRHDDTPIRKHLLN